MASFEKRLVVSRVILGLALVLAAVAQALPWTKTLMPDGTTPSTSWIWTRMGSAGHHFGPLDWLQVGSTISLIGAPLLVRGLSRNGYLRANSALGMLLFCGVVWGVGLLHAPGREGRMGMAMYGTGCWLLLVALGVHAIGLLSIPQAQGVGFFTTFGRSIRR